MKLSNPQEPEIYIVREDKSGAETLASEGPALAMAILADGYTVLSVRLST